MPGSRTVVASIWHSSVVLSFSVAVFSIGHCSFVARFPQHRDVSSPVSFAGAKTSRGGRLQFYFLFTVLLSSRTDWFLAVAAPCPPTQRQPKPSIFCIVSLVMTR